MYDESLFLIHVTTARCFVCPWVGQALGVTDVAPEVVALVSHATQERLRGLIEKLTVMAEHMKGLFAKTDISIFIYFSNTIFLCIPRNINQTDVGLFWETDFQV